jgi:hypothetical protein
VSRIEELPKSLRRLSGLPGRFTLQTVEEHVDTLLGRKNVSDMLSDEGRLGGASSSADVNFHGPFPPSAVGVNDEWNPK